MLANLLITFRETLEAGLIIGITLSVLSKLEQRKSFTSVYWGIFLGVLTSAIGAFFFHQFAGGFEGKSEKIFEGVIMLVGAACITTLIAWVSHQKSIIENLKNSLTELSIQPKQLGVFLIVYTAILREGIETILFLNASLYATQGNGFLGAFLGLILGILVTTLLFRSTLRVSIQQVFKLSNTLLILFAAGLVAHGVHELQEAHVIPTLIQEVWNTNPIVTSGGYPLLHEKGLIGSFLKGLFGYNGNPTLLEVSSYAVYLSAIIVFTRRSRTEKQASS